MERADEGPLETRLIIGSDTSGSQMTGKSNGREDVSPPLFVDAFAGCGGLSLGLKRAGWKGLFAIEKDSCAFDTLSTNFPKGDGVLSYDWPANIERQAWDVNDLLKDRREALVCLAGKVDLLAGGPPCQGFSNAGRRRQDDPRNTLFEAYLELVEILQPRFVLVENVRGFTVDFRSAQTGATQNFSQALQQGLRSKYDISCAVIRAFDYGVPQARPRFFLVGALKKRNQTTAIDAFFDDLGAQVKEFLLERSLPRSPTAKDAISDLEVGRNGTMQCQDTKGFRAIAYKSPRTRYQLAMRDGYEGTPSDTRLARHRPEIRDRFAKIIRSSQEEGRLGMTISSQARSTFKLKKQALRVLDPLAHAPTITSLPDDLIHYDEPRTLTVRENARLQSFPDWFAFKGRYTTGRPPAPPTRYPDLHRWQMQCRHYAGGTNRATSITRLVDGSSGNGHNRHV